MPLPLWFPARLSRLPGWWRWGRYPWCREQIPGSVEEEASTFYFNEVYEEQYKGPADPHADKTGTGDELVFERPDVKRIQACTQYFRMIFSDGRKLLWSMDHLGRRRKDMEEQHERSMQGMLHHLEEMEEEHWLTMQDMWRRLKEMEEHRRSMHDMWRGLDETKQQNCMTITHGVWTTHFRQG
jgi:hypothetical protein